MLNIPKYISIYDLFQQYFQILIYLLFIIALVKEYIIQMQLRVMTSTLLLNYCSNLHH